jgi:large subunit ribosomal protein L4
MAKITLFTSKGSKSGEIVFPKDLLAKENANLMSQAFHIFEDRSHVGTSKVKTRAEVNHTTRKIYKQKGTGGARHGDKKAPIFVGGGVAHGPKGIKRILNISKKLNRLALKMFLQSKVNDKKVFAVASLDALSKSKDASAVLEGIVKESGKKNTANILVVLANDKKDITKYFRNLMGVRVVFWQNLNLRDVYLSNLLLIDKDALNTGAKVKETKKTLVKPEKKVVKKTEKILKTVKKSTIKKTK